MISPADIDEEKTRIFLSHLNRAAKKVIKKEDARQRLEEQVQKLKKSSRSKVYRKELVELEKRLAEVVDKENDITMRQKTREMLNKRMKEKVDVLEIKLTRYIEMKKKRESRIKEIEEKIKRRFSVEQKEIEIIEQQLINLEKMYANISSEKRYTRNQLEKVRGKIDLLKKRLLKIK